MVLRIILFISFCLLLVVGLAQTINYSDRQKIESAKRIHFEIERYPNSIDWKIVDLVDSRTIVFQTIDPADEVYAWYENYLTNSIWSSRPEENVYASVKDRSYWLGIDNVGEVFTIKIFKSRDLSVQ